MIADKYERYRPDVNFMKRYTQAANAASGSDVDANSNVSNKNIATMSPEIHKKANIFANRLVMHDKLTEIYGEDFADEYIRQLESHEVYRQDESGTPVGTPYCVSITLYPFLLYGLSNLGGSSVAPKNLDSFCGGFCNLVFLVAAQFAGAVSTPEFLSYLSYFLAKEYGDDYYLHSDQVIQLGNHPRTIMDVVIAKFQQVVYTLNQPAAARGSQSVFWNIAYFDEPYFKGLFDGFVFPDGTLMTDLWPAVRWLQKEFMRWFNKERTRAIITFPVESFSLLNDGENNVDADSADWVAQMYSEGHSFFTYTSDSVDSLASCCRLRNGLQDNTFSYTLGAGGIATGSKCVITMNVNRLVQNVVNRMIKDHITFVDDNCLYFISEAVREQTKKIHKYLIAFNEILKDMLASHMLPVYEAGYISLEKQYLTVGINGLNEAAEFLGIRVSDNERYTAFLESILKPIYEVDKEDRTKELMFNMECVPAENLGVKNAKWDKKDGYFVPRDCYNSYFYLPDDPKTDVLEKFRLHGAKNTKFCDGGSALHCNLDEHLSKEQYKFLLKYAIKQKTPYFTFNIPNTICNECGYISKHKLDKCPKCGSDNLDYASRVIGYLTRISKWSAERQEEAKRRYYANPDEVVQ